MFTAIAVSAGFATPAQYNEVTCDAFVQQYERAYVQFVEAEASPVRHGDISVFNTTLVSTVELVLMAAECDINLALYAAELSTVLQEALARQAAAREILGSDEPSMEITQLIVYTDDLVRYLTDYFSTDSSGTIHEPLI